MDNRKIALPVNIWRLNWFLATNFQGRDATTAITFGCLQTKINFFKGYLDQIRIYDETLSPSTINAIYVSGEILSQDIWDISQSARLILKENTGVQSNTVSGVPTKVFVPHTFDEDLTNHQSRLFRLLTNQTPFLLRHWRSSLESSSCWEFSLWLALRTTSPRTESQCHHSTSNTRRWVRLKSPTVFWMILNKEHQILLLHLRHHNRMIPNRLRIYSIRTSSVLISWLDLDCHPFKFSDRLTKSLKKRNQMDDQHDTHYLNRLLEYKFEVSEIRIATKQL